MSKKKTHKYTMQSSVRTLSVKCYDEQLVGGWSATSELIRAISSKEMYVIGICHDKDHNHDDIWGTALDKPHYHIIIKMLNNKQKSVGSILKLLGIAYRPGDDDNLWDNHGVETVKNFSLMTTYLTHETEKAHLDGKTVYPMSELVANLSKDEINTIRMGYSRITESVRKYSISEMAVLDEQAYALGYELGNFEAWYESQAFAIRSNVKMRTIQESYYRGVKKRMDEHTELIRLCVFIQGAPNTGKSYAAERALDGYKTLKISGGGSGKFDNLKPYTNAIIIDDDVCPNLLNVSDNYMTSVYRRNKNNPIWTGQYLVVTSNLSFNSWLEQCGITKFEHIDAMRSRFYICELKKIDSYNILYCTSPSTRGNYEQQSERKRMYIEFKDKYNESLQQYILSTEKVDYSDINGECDIIDEGDSFIQMELSDFDDTII